MNLAKNVMIAAAATLAGCASGPEWREPELNQQPVMARQETPAKQEKKLETTLKQIEYSMLTLEVKYSFENALAASGFESYVSLVEKTEGRELTDYERLELAVFQVGKGKTEVKSTDICDAIANYAKAKKMPNVKLPYAALEGDTERLYIEDVIVASEDAASAILKMTEGSDAEKARVAKALRPVYDGKTPLGMKQVAKVKEYLK